MRPVAECGRLGIAAGLAQDTLQDDQDLCDTLLDPIPDATSAG
jgi:hypothetical protein